MSKSSSCTDWSWAMMCSTATLSSLGVVRDLKVIRKDLWHSPTDLTL